MGDSWDRIMAAKAELRIDEEIFYSVLYGRLAYDNAFTPEGFIKYLKRYMSTFQGDVQAEKKLIRAVALESLEQEISMLGLPVRITANEISRREYGIDDVRWLRCWQIARLVYVLKTKGRR